MTMKLRTIDTTIGPLLLAASADGLLRVAFESEDFGRVTDGLVAQHGPVNAEPDAETDGLLDRAEAQIFAYLGGTAKAFDLPVGPLPTTDFRKSVLSVIAAIPFGKTATYGEIAVAAGAPGSARAVGSACASNPLPIVVPCHRVVRSDGSTGQYLGGASTKTALLDLERG